MPKVGAIVPVHNGQQYLERCLDSIHAQTYPTHAYVWDDASDDATVPFLLNRPSWHTKFGGGVKRMGWPYSLDCAAGMALNDGCDYVVPVNCDDFLRLDFVAKTLAMAQAGFDWVLTWGQQVGGRDVVQEAQEHMMTPDMAYQCPLTNYGLYPAKVWQSVGGYPCDVSLPDSFGYKEDHAFHIALMQAGWYNYAVVREPLYYYVMHDGQLHSTGLERHEEAMAIIRKRYQL